MKREMYNPDNLFSKSDKKEKVIELPMVKYKQSLFKKIWNKITSILKK